tara:strand:- start:21363 stop:22280 length:918 start_codon:yes stop_codon:yes gene_type:complete
MKALISGATGLIGRSFLTKYSKEFDEVITLGRSQIDHYKNIDMDISDPCLDDLPNIDVFFHFAAQTSSNAAREDPRNDAISNITAFLIILEKLRQMNEKIIVIAASTSTQKGFTDNIENIPIADDPICFYDLSKLTAERYLKLYCKNKFLRGVSLRLSNVYGSLSNYGKPDRGIIDKVISNALKGKEIFVWGSGEYYRDYIFIEDVIDAFFIAFKEISATNGKHYEIGTSVPVKIIDAFKLIISLVNNLGTYPKLVIKENIKFDSLMDQRSFVANDKFCKETSWKPKISLKEGLTKIITNSNEQR